MTLDRIFLIFALLCFVSLAQVPDGKPHIFHYQGSKFMLDNQEFQLVGGEIHYVRIPIEYWRHRIQMVKALGCNALSVYIFWNYHSYFGEGRGGYLIFLSKLLVSNLEYMTLQQKIKILNGSFK